jgi:hypothetical protein
VGGVTFTFAVALVPPTLTDMVAGEAVELSAVSPPPHQ